MSPTSNRDIKDRARLARQMLRDFPVSKPSEDYERMMSEPPPESTTSSMGFDPDNEALMSTRQIDEVSTDLDDDTSGMLVQLRESARKYKHYNPPEPAVAIDTSTIAKAFPDFSQVCHSASESYASIEAGRGYQPGDSQTEAYLAQWRDDAPRKPRNKANDSLVDVSSLKKQNHAPTNNVPKSSQQPSPKHIPEREIDTVVDNASLMDFTNLNLTRSTLTPPKSSQRKMETLGDMSKQDERELYPINATDGKTQTSPTLAKTTEYGSAGSRNSSQEQRRVPTAYHARVTDEADESYVSDHRLPRNSRFASPSAKILTPVSKFKSAQGNVQTESSKISQKKNGTNDMQYLNEQFQDTQYSGAQASYIMPSLPELSELITGTYNDGTPVFSHSSKPRASRFTGAKDGKTVVKPEHAVVDEIELPKDEQDIMMQLQLLQDRVRDLEAIRAETQVFVQEVQEENMALKQEKVESRNWRRSDSALGSTDGSDLHQDEDRGSRRSLIERTRLEASLRLMQEQYDAEKRKTIVQDVVIKNVSQDRDAATKQLAVAFFAMEQLKNENLRLKEEKSRLESELHSKDDLITRVVQQQQAEDNLRDRFEHTDDLIHAIMEKPQTEKSQPQIEKAQKKSSKKSDNVPSQKEFISPSQVRFPGLYSDKFEDTEDLIRKIMEKPIANKPANDVSAKAAREISAKSSKEVSQNPSKEVPSKPTKEQSTGAIHDNFNRTDKVIQRPQGPAKVVPSTPTKATGVKFGKKQSTAANQASHSVEEVLTRARRNSSGVRQPNFESKATQTQTNQGTFEKHSPGGTRCRDSHRREKFVLGENSFVSDNGEISISEQARQRSEERSLSSRDVTINTEAVAKRQDDNEVSGVVTHLTALADTDFSEMRAKIEHERIAGKQRKIHPNIKRRYPVNVQEHLPTHSNNEPFPLEMHRTLSLKESAMDGGKGLEKQTSKSQAELDETSHSRISEKHHRRHSEDSLLVQRNKRQGLSMENMTSAFIVPDITMRIPGKMASGANLPEATKYEDKNGMVDNVVGDNVKSRSHKEKVKHKTKISRPIPVSERMPEPEDYEDEPTLRPSKPVGVALAIVLKTLDDELAKLKGKMSELQEHYYLLNPTISERKRKLIAEKITSQLKKIEFKCNQIYNLYDVLEGQKAAGQEMAEDEIDITLQSIGVDLSQVGLRGGDLPNEENHSDSDQSWDVDSNGSAELPWEGIDGNTVETNGSGVYSRTLRA